MTEECQKKKNVIIGNHPKVDGQLSWQKGPDLEFGQEGSGSGQYQAGSEALNTTFDNSLKNIN